MKYLLILLHFGVNPTATVVDDYDLPGHCFEAALEYQYEGPDESFFATCVGTDEPSEENMGYFIAAEYGLVPYPEL